MSDISRTPASLGFHMPAEWSAHQRTWMAWPCRTELWSEEGLEPARLAYAAVAKAISRFDKLTMAVRPEDAAGAKAMLGSGIETFPVPLDDSWARDIGPSFVVDGAGKLAAVDWIFNAWGGKYPDYADDAAFAAQVIEAAGVPGFAAPFVLEGGSIHVDGEGTVLTSEQCLLNPNRNPHMTKAEIEQALYDWLGARKVIWLGQGLLDDQTDGHIDNLACFARPGMVVTLVAEDPSDANHKALADNLDRLRKAKDAAGRSLEIVAIPQPAPKMLGDMRLARSYINFYLANGGVVAPRFNDPNDAVAFETLAKTFPERDIVQVDISDIIVGGGGIHCITQQQPAGRV
jgi:agmatine deiminase